LPRLCDFGAKFKFLAQARAYLQAVAQIGAASLSAKLWVSQLNVI